MNPFHMVPKEHKLMSPELPTRWVRKGCTRRIFLRKRRPSWRNMDWWGGGLSFLNLDVLNMQPIVRYSFVFLAVTYPSIELR